MSQIKIRMSSITFRGLKKDFLKELKEGKMHYILDFERENRKTFMVEIRNNFLDLYFLGHSVEVTFPRS